MDFLSSSSREVPCLSTFPNRPPLSIFPRDGTKRYPMVTAASGDHSSREQEKEAAAPPRRNPQPEGVSASTHSPHAPDLQLWLHPRLLRLHRLVGDDGAHGAARAHVVEHDVLWRHRDRPSQEPSLTPRCRIDSPLKVKNPQCWPRGGLVLHFVKGQPCKQDAKQSQVASMVTVSQPASELAQKFLPGSPARWC